MMKKMQVWLIPLVSVVTIALMLAGCAALQKNEVMDAEELLTKAGFQKYVADTPQKMAHLKTLAQQVISRHKRHGKLYFVYADAANCQCLYAGDETDFQHYQDLERQQNNNVIEMDRPDIVTGEEWSQAPWGPFDQ
jgi:PBP1b-binding outer membrane lipoprotein LpoB